MTGQWAELPTRDVVQNPSLTLYSCRPVQTGLPRERAKLLTRATQPGLVSPAGGKQAQWYHSASLSSESGESLRHVRCYSAECVGGTGAATMPQPSILRLIRNTAAWPPRVRLCSSALQRLVECRVLETDRVRLVAFRWHSSGSEVRLGPSLPADL